MTPPGYQEKARAPGDPEGSAKPGKTVQTGVYPAPILHIPKRAALTIISGCSNRAYGGGVHF